MKLKKTLYTTLALTFLLAITSCDAISLPESGEAEALTASGMISARSVKVAPEIGGRVMAVNVEEGQTVDKGTILFEIDDELLQAQYAQALTTVDLAAASVVAAEAQLDSAEIQYQLARQEARLQDMGSRSNHWSGDQMDAIELPIWYYGKDEQISAVEAEIRAAQEDYDTELANLEIERKDASNAGMIAAEERLAAAQTTLENADLTLKQAQVASDSEVLEDAAQEIYDTALAELDSAQLEYDVLLKSGAADDLLAARARAAVAKTRLDNAEDKLLVLFSGEESLVVTAAHKAVEQAEAALSQAEANLLQAESALDIYEVQLAKTVVAAPSAGVVLSLNLEQGELVSPGGVALTIGQPQDLTLTVYVPEDRYGQIKLGQEVSVVADSFPGKTYSGWVQQIAEEAEFTPRNVQTVEGRKSTVFAVKISVPNPDGELKSGMTTDVVFE